jgi:hypothetical protein
MKYLPIWPHLQPCIRLNSYQQLLSGPQKHSYVPFYFLSWCSNEQLINKLRNSTNETTCFFNRAIFWRRPPLPNLAMVNPYRFKRTVTLPSVMIDLREWIGSKHSFLNLSRYQYSRNLCCPDTMFMRVLLVSCAVEVVKPIHRFFTLSGIRYQ